MSTKFLALFYCPADKCGHLTAFSYAGLVANDKCLPLLHLIDGHCHAVNLLSGKCLMQLVRRVITEFLSYELVYVPVLLFN